MDGTQRQTKGVGHRRADRQANSPPQRHTCCLRTPLRRACTLLHVRRGRASTRSMALARSATKRRLSGLSGCVSGRMQPRYAGMAMATTGCGNQLPHATHWLQVRRAALLTHCTASATPHSASRCISRQSASSRLGVIAHAVQPTSCWPSATSSCRWAAAGSKGQGWAVAEWATLPGCTSPPHARQGR